VSWQLAAFAILALGLIAGFAWYERTRPDARIVALVGTLAAFGALGRIAFAAVPNVKPTSDIVLIAGYSLGGAPGFVVGAVAALTSNFFFGQGPWTPWQMAGWGATGIAGALLARLTRRRISRLPLAAASFVLGFAFTALQDVGDWVNYSDHSLAQLGFYVGKGIGFDLVHAAGCFGFALLFGPALIRTLTRFRTRIQVTWLPRASGTTVAALMAVTIAASAVGSAPSRASAAPAHGSPVAYLERAQNPDGGFGSAPGQASDLMDSAWATSALFGGAAQGGAFGRAERYLATTVSRERGAGAIERTVLAAGLLPYKLTDFGGRNLIAPLKRLIRPDGSVQDQTNLTAFWILAALQAGGIAVPQRTLGWLARQQNRDGGFDYATRGGRSDIDDTGAVLEALAGTDEEPTIRRAIHFIREHQNRDGGYGVQPGDPSNAQSTSFAICGLATFLLPFQWARRGRPSPLAYLRSLIQPDGAVDYSRGNSQSPVWVTAEAEIALTDHTL
jgi:energy-coupling factor transport system substrate-specific component